jgi:hypothetical protein
MHTQNFPDGRKGRKDEWRRGSNQRATDYENTAGLCRIMKFLLYLILQPLTRSTVLSVVDSIGRVLIL